jgi:hypothetical protein
MLTDLFKYNGALCVLLGGRHCAANAGANLGTFAGLLQLAV